MTTTTTTTEHAPMGEMVRYFLRLGFGGPDVRVVGVVPELKDDRPEAKVVLAGKQFSTASKHLDQ